MSDNKLFDVFLAASVAKIIVDKDKEPLPTLPWPYNYGVGVFFRVGWSIVTILYLNQVLQYWFNMGPDYLSIFWALALAWVPLLGGILTPIICLLLLLAGVPSHPHDEIYNRLSGLGVERCYVEDCSH